MDTNESKQTLNGNNVMFNIMHVLRPLSQTHKFLRLSILKAIFPPDCKSHDCMDRIIHFFTSRT